MPTAFDQCAKLHLNKTWYIQLADADLPNTGVLLDMPFRRGGHEQNDLDF